MFIADFTVNMPGPTKASFVWRFFETRFAGRNPNLHYCMICGFSWEGDSSVLGTNCKFTYESLGAGIGGEGG